MNLKHIAFLFLAFLTLYACDNDSSTSVIDVPTNDAQIYTFSLRASHRILSDSAARAQDSIRIKQVNKRNFAIDQISSIIYNPDSMPYGTVIERAVIGLTFNSTYGATAVEIITPDSTYSWTATDSVDLSKLPVEIQVTSYGGNIKKYNLDIRTHKVDPDTIVWTQMQSLPVLPEQQKVIKLGTTFYSYSLLNNEILLYLQSASGSGWEKSSVSGLPTNIDFSSISFFENTFFAITSDGDTYLSLDGSNWERAENDVKLITIYGELPASSTTESALLVALQDNGTYFYGIMDYTGDVQVVDYISSSPSDPTIKNSFPLTNFTSVTNYSAANAQNSLLIVGGTDKNNMDLSTTWLVKRISSGIEISSSGENELFAGEGLSTFLYDNSLYVLAENELYISETWGSKWKQAPAKQALPASVSARTNQDVIVDENNYIWIFGGKSTSGTSFNDVWRGRLNRLITD